MAPAVRGACEAAGRAVARPDTVEVFDVDPRSETLGAAIPSDLPAERTAAAASEAVQAVDGDPAAADTVPARVFGAETTYHVRRDLAMLMAVDLEKY